MKEITTCEVCGYELLTSALNLGMHPLCDDLVPIGDERRCQEYPVEVLFCERCKTAHQRFQLPKQVLFPRSYHYRARFTKDVTDGLEGLAASVEERFGRLEGKVVFDIGCNDGVLLDCFKKRGAITLGIEPSDAALEAYKKGHRIWQDYFPECAEKIALFRPDVITFTNVFAHLDDLQEAIAQLKPMIGRKTMVVIENHYLGSVLDRRQFDTFYHEHPRTYSGTSFQYIAMALGVGITHIDYPKRYGGNIRVFLGRGECKQRRENHIRLKAFRDMAEAMKVWRQRKREEILACGRMPAIAFPGRAAILIRLLGLNEEHISAVYQKQGSPKVGHYVPGTRIPIISDLDLDGNCSTVLNLAWHIAGEVREHLNTLGCKARVIDIVNEDDFCIATPLLEPALEATATAPH